ARAPRDDGALRCAPMPITVVGSIAYDTVKTPFGERERMLGGAAVHFALAASFFSEVRIVGPIGDDFGEEQLEVLRRRGVNDAELRELTGKPNLISGAREVLAWGPESPRARGPSVIVAKQGEYGAALVTRDGFFAVPAYPLETVVDPTGAGDTFAGGFLGY